jgi:hypothetical protein
MPSNPRYHTDSNQEPNVFDIRSVIRCKKNNAIIKLADATKETSIPGISDKVNVHENVDVVSSGNGTTSSDVHVENGSELSHSLETNANASAEYLGMKVEAGGGYSYENTVKKSSMYALMAIDQTQFYTELNTGGDMADWSQDFRDDVDTLPDWEEADTVKEQYGKFFEKWGTHVIKRCHYGCRSTLQVETQNASLTNKEEYKANVKAEFGKVFSTGADVKQGNSFEEYQKQRKTSASVIGGNRSSSLQLQREPGSKELFNEWAKSIDDVMNSAVTEIQTATLGQLLNGCGESKGKGMIEALKHFTKSAESQPICVYGYLYTSGQWREGSYINFQIWGDGVSDFELGSLDGGYAKHTDKPSVRELWSNADRQIDGRFHRWTAHVKIYGETGKSVSFGVWHRRTSADIHLYLLPPTGPIQIDFDQHQTWNSATIPDLLASGNYKSG